MKTGVIATWILWNSVMCMSHEVFSSHLKTVVDVPVTSVFRITGPNGDCAHAHDVREFRLNECVLFHVSQNFTFHSDGTLQARGRCIAAVALTPGAEVVQANCGTVSTDAKVWSIQTHGVITNVASGLVLTAMFGTRWTKITLEQNMFSSYQTWRSFDNLPAVYTARIVGMRGYCLRTLNGDVWLAACGSGQSQHWWRIYPDGTIRPQENEGRCLSYDSDKRVVVSRCGLSPTSERWLLTEQGALLNERIGLAMDVDGADPDRRRILVYTPTGSLNQEWKFLHA